MIGPFTSKDIMLSKGRSVAIETSKQCCCSANASVPSHLDPRVEKFTSHNDAALALSKKGVRIVRGQASEALCGMQLRRIVSKEYCGLPPFIPAPHIAEINQAEEK